MRASWFETREDALLTMRFWTCPFGQVKAAALRRVHRITM
jgi:hypothetical protein